MIYDHKKVEGEIQKFWQDCKIFESKISNKQKYYILDMFPYPSGDGLHVGHVKGYTASDVIAHFKRLNGFNVLHPMGWDAFGLPAENYAIKKKMNPRDVVPENINKFKAQCQMMGFSYDWSREIDTTNPAYYKWTQWIFLRLYEKGLAYQDKIAINFCPSCKTGLANEEVISGACERCHTRVERKKLKQWILKITDYADRLLDDLDELDWPEPIKQMQRNWIGKSFGTDVYFKVEGFDEVIEVYTTRVDTIFSGTYLILAPEHPLVKKITTKQQQEIVDDYVAKSIRKSDLERLEEIHDKSAVFTGSYAINPATDDKMPIWISDFVLASYGYGAVFADAHDQRDFDLAKKYNLPLKASIKPYDGKNWDKIEKLEVCYTEDGILVNSKQFDGLTSEQAREKITAWMEKEKIGKKAINYKLRDWIFSRQRYWGEPIPVVHCKKCGTVALSEKDLPLELPNIDDYLPTGTGESPLAKATNWVNTTCPKCNGKALRETDTMPNWAASSWYYIRFADPNNKSELISTEADKYYLPVDFYIGGAEHAVLHLLYARFWHKFLYDEKIVKDNEPFLHLKNVGLILGPDNQKMSKSRGNVINPDDLVDKYGADALRMYELFIGPFDQSATWNISGITGTRKLLEKIFTNFNPQEKDLGVDLQSLINSITSKIKKNLYNTAISDFMKFTNDNDMSRLSINEWVNFLIIFAPFAPHASEFLYKKMKKESIFTETWPDVKITKKVAIYTIQINGKVKATLKSDSDEKGTIAEAKKIPKIDKELRNVDIKKTIFVKNKVINFVI